MGRRGATAHVKDIEWAQAMEDALDACLVREQARVIQLRAVFDQTGMIQQISVGYSSGWTILFLLHPHSYENVPTRERNREAFPPSRANGASRVSLTKR